MNLFDLTQEKKVEDAQDVAKELAQSLVRAREEFESEDDEALHREKMKWTALAHRYCQDANGYKNELSALVKWCEHMGLEGNRAVEAARKYLHDRGYT